jgi:hypothetical protein
MDEVQEAEMLKRLNGRYNDAVELQSHALEGLDAAYYRGMSLGFIGAIRIFEAYNGQIR